MVKIIYKKPNFKLSRRLYTYMNKLFTTLSKSILTPEYRTPFIGSDNQSWAHGVGLGEGWDG
jgi:hypothetical protein